MKFLITIFALGLSVSAANAQSFRPVKPINLLKNTEISGFYIGQSVNEATNKICTDKKSGLGYKIIDTDVFGNKHVDVTKNVFVVKCTPQVDYGEKNYWKEIEGKPTLVSLLIKEGKVAGIHLVFDNKRVLKRTLVNLISSNAVEEFCPYTQKSKYEVKSYNNEVEDWNAWVITPVDRKIVNGVISRMVYIVHVEATIL